MATDRAEQIAKELEEARLYIIEAGPDEREWTKDESLAEWIHHFGKDMKAEARREAFREAAEIATKAAWEGINDARWIAAALEKESQS